MKPEHFTKARKLADKLISTCQPNEFWDDVNELSKDECLALDSIAFECQVCNHWFSVLERQEVGGQWVCSECC